MTNSVVSETSSPIKKIERAYLEARNQWVGCDWPTPSGTAGPDLNGLKSSQAFLLARATAGAEAAEWRAAGAWLARIEQEAQDAETAAEKALLLARAGRLPEALSQAQRACALEAPYHHSPIWLPLREALETALRQSRADNGSS